MNFRNVKYGIVLALIFNCLNTYGQGVSSSLEKVYTQTDRPFYFPGETVWFKAYLVDETNSPSGISDILIAELISPKGDVVATKKLAVTYGYAYGDFNISEEWVGGKYRLRTHTSYQRNFGESSFFEKDIIVQKVVVPNLLLSLDFQKEAYGKGSLVQADFKVEDLNNKALDNLSILFKVYISGKVFDEQSFFTDTNGEHVITFELPENLNTSDVVLQVEVPYKGSVESISRTVPVIMDNIDLQFLPEGGKIIQHASNVIAFKALNEFGKPADIAGIITDSRGNEILAFESLHDGMGTLELKPQNQGDYFARIQKPFVSDSLYILPKIYKEGIKISLKKITSEQTLWDVHSSKPIQGVLRALDVCNNQLFQSTIDCNMGSNEVTIDIKDFPRGITKFQFINTVGNVVSERLVFVNNHKKLHIDFHLVKESYAPREKVKLEIETRDYNGQPISSNLAISVTDNALLKFADDKQDKIDGSLLMSSELKGSIHEPSYYFDPKEENTDSALDLVMLTHGWKDYLNEPLDNLKFVPDKRNFLEGQILDKKGNPTPATLLLFEGNGNKVLEFRTDEEGRYGCKLGDQSSYILVAYREDNKSLQINEEQTAETMQSNLSGSRSNRVRSNNILVKNLPLPRKPLSKPELERARFTTSLFEDAQALEEVVIVGYGSNTTKNALGFAQTSVETDEINGLNSTVSQLLQGRAAGVQITSSSGVAGAGTSINIRGMSSVRGNNEPLIIIDGVPYANSFSGDQSAELRSLNPSDIESVHVLKGVAATTLYGSSGANGVLIVSTKNGFYRGNDKILIQKRFNNYAVKNIYPNTKQVIDTPRSFYMPVYEVGESVTERTDFRNTIYWNPVVQTDNSGKATVEFYNSDAITSYNITGEGVSYSGLLSHAESVYSIQSPVSISSKIPNYLSLNDTINLPITITNNTAKDIKLKLVTDIPEQFEYLNPRAANDSITVPANGYVLKHLGLIPKAEGTDINLGVSVMNKTYEDGFSRELEIISPYFPIQTSVSSSQEGTFTFDIVNPIPQSTKATFEVYVDVIGDVMNGIEGMIREPYGCFEQTSSATYPNIMVLKYLKETGRSNPDIELKALDFIRKGYKRLVGFETSRGGFEWFGHTPPHETLTAFGIMEFTEMKEVYDGVSDKMLSRTIDWLLEQKDGQGGFHKSTKGYSSFTSSPVEVANAYIVYALSEVGISEEITLEYQIALREAFQSQDAYRMALMALASNNLNRQNEYNELIEILLQQIIDQGYGSLPVENTITRSYGNSKNLETAAFVTLALMEDERFFADAAQGIQYLASNRSNGRFGSTQSTVMSLKAMIEYSKRQKRIIQDSNNSVLLQVNGQNIESSLFEEKNGVLEINGIEEYLTQGKQTLSVQFNGKEESFPYSLNVLWQSNKPKSAEKVPVILNTTLNDPEVSAGSLVRMQVKVKNENQTPVSMTTALIGIPSGASLQPYQLKELSESRQVDYYEVFDNYLVLYWKSLDRSEEKFINLDLKADIPGSFTAPASAVYLYYGEEYKYWVPGTSLSISDKEK